MRRQLWNRLARVPSRVLRVNAAHAGRTAVVRESGEGLFTELVVHCPILLQVVNIVYPTAILTMLPIALGRTDARPVVAGVRME